MKTYNKPNTQCIRLLPDSFVCSATSFNDQESGNPQLAPANIYRGE